MYKHSTVYQDYKKACILKREIDEIDDCVLEEKVNEEFDKRIKENENLESLTPDKNLENLTLDGIKNYKSTLLCIMKYGLDYSEEMLKDVKFFNNCLDFPTVGEKSTSLGITILSWKRECPRDFINFFSNQGARSIKGLRSKGFCFKLEKGKTVYINEEGIACCKIEGFDYGREFSRFIQMDTNLRIVRSQWSQVFNVSLCELELDHRSPKTASDQDQKIIKDPSREEVLDLLEKGTFFDDFVFISRKENMAKKVICGTCLKTDKISVPKNVDYWQFYKTERKFSCVGCIFYDRLILDEKKKNKMKTYKRQSWGDFVTEQKRNQKMVMEQSLDIIKKRDPKKSKDIF